MQQNLLNDLLKNELFGKLIGNALEKQQEKKETIDKETNTSDLSYEIVNSLKEKMIVLPLDSFNRLDSNLEKLKSNISLLNEGLQNLPSILQTIQSNFDAKNKFGQNDELLSFENQFEMEETARKPRIRSQTNKKKDTNSVFQNLKELMSKHWIDPYFLLEELSYHEKNCCNSTDFCFERDAEVFLNEFIKRKDEVITVIIKKKRLPYLKSAKNLSHFFERQKFETFSFQKFFKQLKDFEENHKELEDLDSTELKREIIQELHKRLEIQKMFLVGPSKGDYLKRKIKKILKS